MRRINLVDAVLVKKGWKTEYFISKKLVEQLYQSIEPAVTGFILYGGDLNER